MFILIFGISRFMRLLQLMNNIYFKLNFNSIYIQQKMSTKSINQEDQSNDNLINELKAEIYELKKSQEDYYLLEGQLKRLQSKYKLLNQQKLANDQQYQSNRDNYSKTILQYKHEISVYKDELKQKIQEFQQIQTQGQKLKKICEERNIELQNNKYQRASQIQQQSQLSKEQERIDQQISSLKIQKENLIRQLAKSEKQAEQCLKKNKETEKIVKQLSEEAKAFKQDIAQLNNQIQQMERQYRSKDQEEFQIQKQISDATSAIRQLQIDINEVSSQNDKHKGQISHYNRLIQSQNLRHNELLKNIAMIEDTLKLIEDQKDQLNDGIAEIKLERQEIKEINNKLELDNQNCEKHIKILSTQNQYLLIELDKFSEEDENVRNMLNRKQKIKQSRQRADVSSKVSRRSNRSKY